MSLLLPKKKKKKIVLFLCTGDTCRGPMAQGYMKKAMEERGIKDIEIKTAGIMTSHGLIPTQEATLVMRNADVDINGHRSAVLTEVLIRKADLILGMSPLQTQYAKRLSEEAIGKTYLLKEYAESDLKNYQINDPMGATLEVYKRVYREMKLAIDKMLDTKEFFAGPAATKAKKKTATASRKKSSDGKSPSRSRTSKSKTSGNSKSTRTTASRSRRKATAS